MPFKLLRKHGDQLFQLEALFFGQSGLLDKVEQSDYYHRDMSKEYRFLAHKYSLKEWQLSVAQWKFLRMRPANFPTIRLAQFAALHHQHQTLFSKLLLAENIQAIEQLLEIEQSTYWKTHYIFGKESKRKIAGLGKQSIYNIIINTIVPLLVAYGQHRSEQIYIDKGLELLNQIPTESNKIIKEWRTVGLKVASAFDSQAAIEWYQEYCKTHQCLRCNVGVKLIR